MTTKSELPSSQPNEKVIPRFAAFAGEQLFPPSFPMESAVPAEYFQENFPERFKIWQITKSPFALDSFDVAKTKKSRTWLTMANNLDRYSTAHYSGKRKILKTRQMDVFDDISASVEQGEKEGYIEAPTGFGKTVLFGEIVAATDIPTVIVVPTKKLVEQTYKSLKKFNPDLSVGRVYGDKKEYGEQVTVTTYQTLTGDTESTKIPFDQTALLILDEVDEATSIERIKAIEKFPDAQILGVSATPVKVKGEEFADSRVAKTMENEIHAISLLESVADGYLSSFSSYIVEVDTDITNVVVTQNGNYNEEALENVINTRPHNEAAVKFFLEVKTWDQQMQREAGKKKMQPLTTSVFASSVQHAKDLAEEFLSAGVSAAAVWGTQNPTEQARILQQWADGEIEVVCSKNLLVRGNDIPKIRLVENVAPTANVAVEKQRSGRGLRLDEDNPDKHTIIADFVYKTSSKKAQQVTFAQVVGKAEMYRTPVSYTHLTLPTIYSV